MQQRGTSRNDDGCHERHQKHVELGGGDHFEKWRHTFHTLTISELTIPADIVFINNSQLIAVYPVTQRLYSLMAPPPRQLISSHLEKILHKKIYEMILNICKRER